MPEHLIIVDDDATLRNRLKKYFEKEGFRVSAADGGGQLRKIMEDQDADLVILDLMMPGEDGLSLTSYLRQTSDAGVVILTGKGDTVDRVVGLELGADDYLTKPIDPRELVMRLNSNLNRSAGAGVKSGDILHVGDFVIDRARHEAHGPGGVAIKFTLAELHLIWVLAEADGKVMSRDVLIDAISDGEGPETFRAIDVTVSRVRKKLGKDAVVTVFNKGYKCGLSVARPG